MEESITKAADEHYCSSCGKIIKIAAEICPHCGVRQIPISEVIENSKGDKQLGKKFFLTSGVAFGVFTLLILSTLPSEEFLNGTIGSFVFALIAGLISMTFPTTKKIIYIPSSIAIMFFVAMLIGLNTPS